MTTNAKGTTALLLDLFNTYENTRFEADRAWAVPGDEAADAAELKHRQAREALVEALTYADATTSADLVLVPSLTTVKHRAETPTRKALVCNHCALGHHALCNGYAWSARLNRERRCDCFNGSPDTHSEKVGR